MRVYSSKALEFTIGPERAGVARGEFATVPDWVKKSAMFNLAVKEGSLKVLDEPVIKPASAEKTETAAKEKETKDKIKETK